MPIKTDDSSLQKLTANHKQLNLLLQMQIILDSTIPKAGFDNREPFYSYKIDRYSKYFCLHLIDSQLTPLPRKMLHLGSTLMATICTPCQPMPI